ncbi:MAG: RNA degradosome polyphosphate kinase [Bacteroidia bacterium]
MLDEQRYFYRDLSWLSFNYRVLLEAKDTSLPLYERIKFLAIYSSNMGEFFKVRVASIQSLIKAQRDHVGDPLLFDPEELLTKIFDEVNRQQEEFGQIFRNQILPELAQNNIHLVNREVQEKAHQAFVEELFENEIQVFLHPELLRKDKINHFLRDSALYLAVKLRNRPRNYDQLARSSKKLPLEGMRIRYAIIQVPTHYFPRFVELPRIGDNYYYMFLDDVIRYNLPRIFPGYDVLCCHSFKLNRNADLQIDDEFSGNLVDMIRNSLKLRRVGLPARFLYDKDMPESMLKYLRDTFGIKKRELMPGGTYHSYFDFFTFPNPHAPRLERTPTPPQPHVELAPYSSMFEAIAHRNWVLHFPYHSYDYVIKFLNEAASDPEVKAIYVTQYRVASNSAIVNALSRAAGNGKQVTVFVEIKARFDEASNLQSAREMQASGVNIIYSIPGLKVHAKMALVLRNEGGRERGYAYLSTGNFNEKTAKIYADHGHFTADETVIREMREIFAHLQNRDYTPPPFRRLMVSQFNLRERFVELIDREIGFARAGQPAEIFIKINNLEDRSMVDKLYEASQAGVRIRLIVRGICRLRPGIEGLSEHIEVRRLVDQFLEHARVFVFRNGGQEELYLSSADWMTRNLVRRIELAFEIKDAGLKEEIKAFLRIQWADNTKMVRIDRQGRNQPIDKTGPAVRAQTELYFRIRDNRLLDPLPMEEPADPKFA